LIALKNCTLNSLQDVDDFYFAFFNKLDGSSYDYDRISHFLIKLKLEVSTIEKTIDDKNNRKTLLECVQKIIDENEELIKKKKKQVPFSGVPSQERSLLNDIMEISNASEKVILQEKLNELASAIKIRQETINQLSEEKGLSLKWAKRGLFGTVLFSLISIALTIFK
jgi:hypothetical protein